MTLHHNREFIDTFVETDARREARRVSIIGSIITLVLGVGLVSLLIYGPMSDGRISELSTSDALMTPHVPTPQAPTP